ncbi:MAG: hypothetical protein IJZ34_11735 [Lachnospiraceae bacterium]|nr:hypothetical protein [Lachnospiraceae bacterium]
MLRIDLNLLWTIINILIILVIVKKFLLKPVNKILAARQEEIDKQYAEARAAEEKARQLEEQVKAAMNGIEEQRNQTLKEARGKAEEEYQRRVTEAKTEADKILADARTLADREQEKRMEQAQYQIADLVVAAAAKLVASKAGEKEDEALYNQFLAKTGGSER